MAPDLRGEGTSSLCAPYRRTTTSSAIFSLNRDENPFRVCVKGENYTYSSSVSPKMYWSHKDMYDKSFTASLIYPSQKAEEYVKKVLKKMANEMCKEGWVNHIPYYLVPKLIPLNLRGVRYDGKGWANKNIH